MKILIEVQCFNRKPITEITLNQLSKYKDDCDLRIVNDYSDEYDNEWLKQFSDETISYEKKLTISKLKYRTFKNLFRYIIQSIFQFFFDFKTFNSSLFSLMKSLKVLKLLPFILLIRHFFYYIKIKNSKNIQDYDIFFL
jgi:hypothetical protein